MDTEETNFHHTRARTSGNIASLFFSRFERSEKSLFRPEGEIRGAF
jgi:hypothetical protein